MLPRSFHHAARQSGVHRNLADIKLLAVKVALEHIALAKQCHGGTFKISQGIRNQDRIRGLVHLVIRNLEFGNADVYFAGYFGTYFNFTVYICGLTYAFDIIFVGRISDGLHGNVGCADLGRSLKFVEYGGKGVLNHVCGDALCYFNAFAADQLCSRKPGYDNPVMYDRANGKCYRVNGRAVVHFKAVFAVNLDHVYIPRLRICTYNVPKVADRSKENEPFPKTGRKKHGSGKTVTDFFGRLLSSPRWKGTVMYKCKSSTLLTARRRRRMVRPIGGKNPPWGRRNSLSRRLAVTLVTAIFVSGFRARQLAYGGKARFPVKTGEQGSAKAVFGDRTPFGEKPRACLVTGFYLPAASAVVESFAGGVVKRYHEGFDMTEDVSGRNPSDTSQITPENAPVRDLSRAERAAINRRATDVATMLFPYVRDYMQRSAMERLRTSDKLKISELPIPPDVGLMIARYRTFGVDGFDPCDPAAQRQVCSVGAATTLIEAIKTLREIADGQSPENPHRAKVATVVSCLLSIEIDAGVL